MEALNFYLTNYLPRRAVTRWVAAISRSTNPLIKTVSIWLWQKFADDLRLDEAKQTDFASLHECFIRQLKPGARTINQDASVVVSPCDAIVGAFGQVESGSVLQVKGSPYHLQDLLLDDNLTSYYEGGTYLTLRLKSSMYHRFHAPARCQLNNLRFVPGDTYNVNPETLARLDNVFCRNERAVLPLEVEPGVTITLVPVAAILVASLRLHGLDDALHQGYSGPLSIALKQNYERGQEMGYFEHGSTIILFAPPGSQVDNIAVGQRVNMGQRLISLPAASGVL